MLYDFLAEYNFRVTFGKIQKNVKFFYGQGNVHILP